MPTEGEIESAMSDAQAIINRQFASPSRRRWTDRAHDKAVDAVMRAAAAHDSARPFAPFARSYVRQALRGLLRDLNNQNRPSTRGIDEAEIAGQITISSLPSDLIAILTPLQQETLARKYEQGESYSMIGKRRGVSKQAAQRAHKRAVIKLKMRIS